jgi:hypothetical protein
MKKLIPIILIVIVVGLGAFWGGMKYGQSKSGPGRLGQPNEAGMGFKNMKNGQNGGFTGGEIISMDDQSMTVKIQDGGSKIVFFSDSAKITKSTDGTIDDLKIGENIIVTGETNQDGSVTAQTIQIR